MNVVRVVDPTWWHGTASPIEIKKFRLEILAENSWKIAQKNVQRLGKSITTTFSVQTHRNQKLSSNN